MIVETGLAFSRLTLTCIIYKLGVAGATLAFSFSRNATDCHGDADRQQKGWTRSSVDSGTRKQKVVKKDCIHSRQDCNVFQVAVGNLERKIQLYKDYNTENRRLLFI